MKRPRGSCSINPTFSRNGRFLPRVRHWEARDRWVRGHKKDGSSGQKQGATLSCVVVVQNGRRKKGGKEKKEAGGAGEARFADSGVGGGIEVD